MFKRWIPVDKGKSALVIGPRRCGKTTLLRQLFPDYRYFTLDDLDHLEWAKRDPKGFIQAAGNKAIIDEIQRFPALTIAVKYAIDNEDAILMMTASSTVGLLDASADTLAGRINLIELPTACWGEDDGKPRHSLFSGASPSPPQMKSGTRKMREALTFGQFPEILTTDGAEDKESLLKNYRDTYFSRDLMQLANLENLEGLIAIFANLIRSLGSHLEVSSFAREAGLSYPTAKKYLNTLNQSRLTFKLYGYQYGPAKRHIKAAKTYFADNGIINSFNVQIGEEQLFENFVIAELEKRRKLGLIQADRFYYYRSTSGREIDLVFEEKDTVYAVEIKASRNPDRRDFRNLIEFGKSIEKKTKLFLIYQGEDHTTVDGVRLLPVALLYRGA